VKRGRPSLRSKVKPLILETLSSGTLLTTHAITQKISEQLGKRISWNTIYKYLRELIEANKIKAITLPHSKVEGKQGLVVYQIIK